MAWVVAIQVWHKLVSSVLDLHGMGSSNPSMTQLVSSVLDLHGMGSSNPSMTQIGE